MIKILIVLCMFLRGDIQYLTKENYTTKTAHGIAVVEFWAPWNSANGLSPETIDLIYEEGSHYYRVDITTQPELATKYNVDTLPTIIIYSEGVKRYEHRGTIQFTLSADDIETIKKEVTGY